MDELGAINFVAQIGHGLGGRGRDGCVGGGADVVQIVMEREVFLDKIPITYLVYIIALDLTVPRGVQNFSHSYMTAVTSEVFVLASSITFFHDIVLPRFIMIGYIDVAGHGLCGDIHYLTSSIVAAFGRQEVRVEYS